MRTILVALALIVSACATEAVRYIVINYTVLDHPETKSLNLSYHNDQNKNICIDSSNWPNSNGIIDNSGNEFYIEVDGKKYFLKSQQDYCPGCGFNLKPGKSIEGMLKYESFELPHSLYDRTKTLHLKSTGFICRGVRGLYKR